MPLLAADCIAAMLPPLIAAGFRRFRYAIDADALMPLSPLISRQLNAIYSCRH